MTRLLKNRPDLVKEILDNPGHKYYNIAKRLDSAGVITVNTKTDSIEIDGKIYRLEKK